MFKMVEISAGERMFGLIYSALSTWPKTFLLAVSCWLVSLVVMAVAFGLAFVGGPLSIVLFFLGWLLTVGLPTSLAIVTVLSLWQGNSAEAFLMVVAIVALIFHFLCLSMVRQLTLLWWRAKP